MMIENEPNRYESAPKIVSFPPASESLLESNSPNSPWPKDVLENPTLLKEATERRDAIDSIDTIFNKISKADTSVDSAIDQGLITEKELESVYNKLFTVLSSDDLNTRMILYVPFELLPSKNWSPNSIDLRDSASKFSDIYMDKWYEMLGVNDVRANFVDGDVLEVELRDKPLARVTKAVHLLPKLLEKGLISIDEVIELLNNHTGLVLATTIVQTLPVLADLGFITNEEVNNITKNAGTNSEKTEAESITEEKITPARKKWLKEMEEKPDITQRSAKDLELPFIKKEESLKNDIDNVRSVIETIESDEILKESLFPVSIIFGSKIKGYSADNADIDVAVFVKPGTDIEKRAIIQRKLSEINPNLNFVEFWLEEKEDILSIIDSPSPDRTMADSSWSHVLFEGVWIGNDSSIKELHEKLLVGFLFSKDKTLFGADARKIWLEEIERDTLQYRLMHKGYERFNERQGGINTEHSKNIDSESMFYDSGYRRLATKLFLSKVFLPQLDK